VGLVAEISRKRNGMKRKIQEYNHGALGLKEIGETTETGLQGQKAETVLKSEGKNHWGEEEEKSSSPGSRLYVRSRGKGEP